MPSFIRCCVPLLCAALLPAQSLRPPAVPLIVHDPYFSIWSAADRLTDVSTKHWSGTDQAIGGMARIDGKVYRFIGNEKPRRDVNAPAPMRQTSVEVLPTRTIYQFEADGVALTLTFITPTLPDDLDILSRPVTYLDLRARAADGRQHAVSLYLDACAQLAVNNADEQGVAWSRFQVGGLEALRMGSQQQPVLEKDGDNLRIDWGYLYLAAPAASLSASVMTDRTDARLAFMHDGKLPASDDLGVRKPMRFRMPVLALTFDLGAVGAAEVSRHALIAYDDLYSIAYFERPLRPYWRRKGAEASDLLGWAERDYSDLAERCRRFDDELMADLRRAGGEKYAQISALAYRQSFGAHKLVADVNGTPLFFPKENFSNGCIGTVDVFYPSSPLFLLVNPRLLRASVQPLLDYALMERWPFPFAPHDLGRYPKANGQVYGGGEKNEVNQMPVEESGNLLLLVAALAHIEGNADFAARYWPLLTKWAAYLKEKGLDPENQLSTDDFAGHLAHNANLSIKAILALASYARLCEMTHHSAEGALYRRTAEEFARQWVKMASDGDHYRLAFDKPGTWSQKYNLIWDRLLDLKIFPPEVTRTEIAYYKTVQQPFGLPLDNRQPYTKLDWIFWTASLASTQPDFLALTDPAWRFANETPDRVPLTDWYWTQTGKQQHFQARSVVGGLFVKMLTDDATWRKWAARGEHRPRP